MNRTPETVSSTIMHHTSIPTETTRSKLLHSKYSHHEPHLLQAPSDKQVHPPPIKSTGPISPHMPLIWHSDTSLGKPTFYPTKKMYVSSRVLLPSLARIQPFPYVRKEQRQENERYVCCFSCVYGACNCNYFLRGYRGRSQHRADRTYCMDLSR
jgi:hypothetical protein